MIDTIRHALSEIANNRDVIQALTVLIVLYGLYSVYVLSKLRAYPFRPFIFPVFVAVEVFVFYMHVLVTSPPPSAGATFFSGLIRLQTAAAFAITIKYLIKRVKK